jgi:hypothetical protein
MQLLAIGRPSHNGYDLLTHTPRLKSALCSPGSALLPFARLGTPYEGNFFKPGRKLSEVLVPKRWSCLVSFLTGAK